LPLDEAVAAGPKVFMVNGLALLGLVRRPALTAGLLFRFFGFLKYRSVHSYWSQNEENSRYSLDGLIVFRNFDLGPLLRRHLPSDGHCHVGLSRFDWCL
jgi:hypothetical protein